MGKEFQLSTDAIKMATDELAANINAAKEVVYKADTGSLEFKDKLVNFMEKRWNGTFALIGQNLSKKQ